MRDHRLPILACACIFPYSELALRKIWERCVSCLQLSHPNWFCYQPLPARWLVSIFMASILFCNLLPYLAKHCAIVQVICWESSLTHLDDDVIFLPGERIMTEVWVQLIVPPIEWYASRQALRFQYQINVMYIALSTKLSLSHSANADDSKRVKPLFSCRGKTSSSHNLRQRLISLAAWSDRTLLQNKRALGFKFCIVNNAERGQVSAKFADLSLQLLPFLPSTPLATLLQSSVPNACIWASRTWSSWKESRYVMIEDSL